MISMGSHTGTCLFVRGTVLLPFGVVLSNFRRNVVYEMFYFNHDEIHEVLKQLPPTDFALLNSAKSGGGLILILAN